MSTTYGGLHWYTKSYLTTKNIFNIIQPQETTYLFCYGALRSVIGPHWLDDSPTVPSIRSISRSPFWSSSSSSHSEDLYKVCLGSRWENNGTTVFFAGKNMGKPSIFRLISKAMCETYILGIMGIKLYTVTKNILDNLGDSCIDGW